MNVLAAVDERGEVTRISLEAQIALEDRDTTRSAEFFRRAGEMLESSVAGLTKASERDLARFLEATHFYKGGVYAEAARACGRIQPRRLPVRVRHLYPPFLKQVQERSRPDYARRQVVRIRTLYGQATEERDCDAARQVIDLPIDHPYLFPPYFMAHMRARCSDVLGLRRATTLFYRDAWRFNPDRPYALPPYLDSLCKEGKYKEAWEVVGGELAERPGARSSIYAMMVINAVRIRDGLSEPAEGQDGPKASLADLLDHFEAAERACRSLAKEEREEIALLIDFAFSIAWVAHMERGDATRQRETLDRWISLRPNRPDPYVLRGMMSDPGPESIRDFEAAVRLHSDDPWPYHVLAAEALRAGNYRECDRLCRLALERQPDTETRATLLGWRAVSGWNLGHDRSEIRRLFDEAQSLNPHDPMIADHGSAFRSGAAPLAVPDITIDGDRHRSELARRHHTIATGDFLESMNTTTSLTAA